MSVNEVLERNLEALFKRSYVPVLPEPHFRERVIRLVLDELDLRHGRQAKKRIWPERLAVAAALLITIGAAFFLLPERAPTVSELLAQGSEAVRGVDGDWRAATDVERAHSVLEAWTAAATPVDGRLILESDAGYALLASNTRLDRTMEGGAPVLTLGRGSVQIGHESASPWRVKTRHGEVLLHHGELSIREDAALLEFELIEGAAELDVHGERIAMSPGDVRRVGPIGLLGPVAIAMADAGDEMPSTGSDERRVVTAEPSASAGSDATNRLIVRVKDSESGTPIEAGTLALLAEQQLNRPETARIETFRSEDGEATWRGDIDDGRYFVFVQAEGRALLHAGEITFGEKTRQHVLEAELEPGGTRSGFIVDARTGEPVSGAWIISYRDTPAWGLPFHDPGEDAFWSAASTHSRLDGSFTLEHLSPGKHVLQASASGRAPTWIEVEVEARTDERLADIGLTQGGDVHGVITDSSSAPIAGEQVIAYATEGAARDMMAFGYTKTDTEGRYSIRDLPEGTFLIIRPAQIAGTYPEVKPAEIRPGVTAQVDFLGHVTGVTLQGQLVRADGSPFPPTNLGCFRVDTLGSSEDWIASTSQADGSFLFEDLAPADYAIYASGEYGQEIKLLGEVTVPDVETHTARIVVGSNRIHGTVKDGLRNEPVSAILLFELHGPKGAHFAGMTRTQDDGSYELDGLPDGFFRVTAYPLSRGAQGAEGAGNTAILGVEDVPSIESTAAEPLELDLVCWPGARASVRVLTPDGEPLAGAGVTFEDADGQTFAFGRNAQTDAQGLHEAYGLRPGSYTLEVIAPGFQRVDRPIEAREGRPLEIELTLQPASQPKEPADARGDAR